MLSQSQRADPIRGNRRGYTKTEGRKEQRDLVEERGGTQGAR